MNVSVSVGGKLSLSMFVVKWNEPFLPCWTHDPDWSSPLIVRLAGVPSPVQIHNIVDEFWSQELLGKPLPCQSTLVVAADAAAGARSDMPSIPTTAIQPNRRRIRSRDAIDEPVVFIR